MKKIIVLVLIPLIALVTGGCDNDDEIVYVSDPPPQSPQGVFSVTGDGQVTIGWLGLWEDDIVEYVVGWNDALLGEYEEVGRVPADPRDTETNLYWFVDTDVDNGTTYFYSVWAVDEAGQVSRPSYEAVFDTPRPQGQVELYSRFASPVQAGFDLSQSAVVPWDATTADVFIDHIEIADGDSTLVVLYLNTANPATDIQDKGYTDDFDDVDWAPVEGWSDLQYYEVIPGHTYVIWTADYHYAKMRVSYVSRDTRLVAFEWAYQVADTTNELGNRELMPPPPESEVDPEHVTAEQVDRTSR
ncbi:MAG TPA: fibronectin type III domain-containing protein [Acidobacteriota bacterium]|nr:fibronectin type III domain-containing protein [Acidobacteriota bacterium]